VREELSKSPGTASRIVSEVYREHQGHWELLKGTVFLEIIDRAGDHRSQSAVTENSKTQVPNLKQIPNSKFQIDLGTWNASEAR
jgi:hypothetical protein